MAVASARYWINKAEGEASLEQMHVYALMAQAEALISIAELMKLTALKKAK